MENKIYLRQECLLLENTVIGVREILKRIAARGIDKDIDRIRLVVVSENIIEGTFKMLPNSK